METLFARLLTQQARIARIVWVTTSSIRLYLRDHIPAHTITALSSVYKIFCRIYQIRYNRNIRNHLVLHILSVLFYC